MEISAALWAYVAWKALDVVYSCSMFTAVWSVLLQALCAVLEYEICDNNDVKMQIITTLQSTSRGKRMYADLCERQIQLRELVSSY